MKTIRDYLNDMKQYAERIAHATRDGKQAFKDDFVIQDAVIRQYEVIGEIAKRLPDELLAKQPSVDWKGVKGFRDFLAHNYDRIDPEIVWSAVEQLSQLQQAIDAMISELSNEDEPMTSDNGEDA